MNSILKDQQNSIGKGETRMILILFIIVAISLFILNIKSAVLPVEIALCWMINAMINELFILVTVANLKVINISEELTSALSIIIGMTFLIPMFTLFSVIYFLKVRSIIGKTIIFILSFFAHNTIPYVFERFRLVNISDLSLIFPFIYWGAALIINIILFMGYRKVLTRAGIMYESITSSKKL